MNVRKQRWSSKSETDNDDAAKRAIGREEREQRWVISSTEKCNNHKESKSNAFVAALEEVKV
jgi:hypothetical protein